MTSFAGRVARQQGAVFRTLGEDAIWSGLAEPVRVRFREEDDEVGFRQTRLIAGSRVLLVRRSEVAEPAEDQEVVLIASGRRFRLSADPQLDRKGRWACTVQELTAAP